MPKNKQELDVKLLADIAMFLKEKKFTFYMNMDGVLVYNNCRELKNLELSSLTKRIVSYLAKYGVYKKEEITKFHVSKNITFENTSMTQTVIIHFKTPGFTSTHSHLDFMRA